MNILLTCSQWTIVAEYDSEIMWRQKNSKLAFIEPFSFSLGKSARANKVTDINTHLLPAELRKWGNINRTRNYSWRYEQSMEQGGGQRTEVRWDLMAAGSLLDSLCCRGSRGLHLLYSFAGPPFQLLSTGVWGRDVSAVSRHVILADFVYVNTLADQCIRVRDDDIVSTRDPDDSWYWVMGRRQDGHMTYLHSKMSKYCIWLDTELSSTAIKQPWGIFKWFITGIRACPEQERVRGWQPKVWRRSQWCRKRGTVASGQETDDTRRKQKREGEKRYKVKT